MRAKKSYCKTRLLRFLITASLFFIPPGFCFSANDLSPHLKSSKQLIIEKNSPFVVKPKVPVVGLPGPVVERFQLRAYRTYDSENKLYSIKCVEENIIVKIYEDPANSAIDIIINGLQESLPEDDINEFTIRLCGVSNTLAYQLKGPATKIIKNRQFNLHGSRGFDYVELDMSENTSGDYISLNASLVFNLNFHGGNDIFEARLNHIEENSNLIMDVKNIHGTSLIWRNRAKIRGSANINFEGDVTNDDFFIRIMDVDIEKEGSINLNIYGDNKQLFADNNQTVHGNDLIRFGYKGKVDGNFSTKLHGDDGAFRIAASRCISTPCDLFQGRNPRGSALEDQLRNNRDYAFDDVQAAFILLPESLGESNVLVNTGLGNDIGVLLYRNLTDSHTGHEYSLNGGPNYRGQADTCYPERIEGTPSACLYFDRGIVDSYYDFFFE